MQQTASRLDMLDRVVSDGVRLGIGQLAAEDDRLDGRSVRLHGRDLVNFASCSYLGLEMDPRLRGAVVSAVEHYGTQFSSSRVYVSAPPYDELERLLGSIFGAHVIAAPSTTLGHLAAIPTLVDERDAVVLDHQVHHSVQMACTQVRALGAHLEIVRHNRIDLLEERIRDLCKSHRHVWYMADGVYSMYGDIAPFEDLARLLDSYEQFRLYVDDAHGMSWSGEHGRGVALDRIELHPHMVLTASLNKAFAAAGGALVFPDAEDRRRVRTCGGPLLFSGPIQPPLLGAALASARIHLSDEIKALQAMLLRRYRYCDELLRSRDLPILSSGHSPIQFVGMGLTRVAQNMTGRLMREGFFTSVAQFPATPMKRGGVRFTLTLHQTEQDIRALVEAIDHHFAPAVQEEGESVEDVWRSFGLASPPTMRVGRTRRTTSSLRLERHDSIASLPRSDWDRCLGSRGAFDAAGLQFLERCFTRPEAPQNDWRFRYYRVIGPGDRTVLATFGTEALWKADMLAPESISRAVEEERKHDPLHLTLRTLSLGSLLTEGNHLYLDRSLGGNAAGGWKEALSLLISALAEDADASGSEVIALRDLPADDVQLDEFLGERGFTKIPMPETMVVDLDWTDEDGFLRSLSPKARYHQRRRVKPWDHTYQIEILRAGDRVPSPREFAHFFRLYKSVKWRRLSLNTFDLPDDIFEHMLASQNWEIALFRLRPEFGGAPDAQPVGLGACFLGSHHYVPTVIGLDYRYVRSHGLYRQCLRHALARARELGKRRVLFGMGASLEKRRFGARPVRSALFVLAKDHYAIDVIAHMGGGLAA